MFVGMLALLGMGWGDLAYAIPLNILINACIFWVVTNHMMDIGGSRFTQCLYCSVWMMILALIVLYILGLRLFFFIKFPLAGAVFYYGAIAIIEGSMEIIEGGWSIMILFIVTSLFVRFMIISAMV